MEVANEVPVPATAQNHFRKCLRIGWVQLVFAALRDEKADMRQTFLTPAPSFELMADVFSPSIRKSFLQDVYDLIDKHNLFFCR